MATAAAAAVATALKVAGSEDHEAVFDVVISFFGQGTFELRNVDLLKTV